MSNDFELKIVDRENHGTADSRRSRSKGFIPAVLYGAKRDPRHLLIDSWRKTPSILRLLP